MYDTAQPHIAAFVIFRRDDGKIAFVLRQNTNWMNGHYGLIAGKVEKGESFLQAAVRESKEEAGVDVTTDNLTHVLTMHRDGGDGMSWVDVLFEAKDWQGEPYNAEPDKHASLDWLDPEDLPANVIPVCKTYLEKIEAGEHYAEYNWE